jgi:ADP-ribosyl-[dinitrogen reductase] hydrolase
MRLAPVVLRYHDDIKTARDQAHESSFSTHPGALAAEACAFMAHVIVNAIHRPDSKTTAREFLDNMAEEYLNILGESPTGARKVLQRLLFANEPDSSTERCWNWKSENLGLELTLANRGSSYNGYPVSPGYFGAFSLDGLAMSLNCMYTTNDFPSALVKIVNMRGDSDTTGSICCQMAGAFYGFSAIDPVWLQQLHTWDNREIELRAILLFMTNQANAL